MKMNGNLKEQLENGKEQIVIKIVQRDKAAKKPQNLLFGGGGAKAPETSTTTKASYSEKQIEQIAREVCARQGANNPPAVKNTDTGDRGSGGSSTQPSASSQNEGKRLNLKQIEQICEDVCGGKADESRLSHIPDAKDLEHAHEEDLDVLEQAIAEKRLQLQAEHEMEHIQAKGKLEARIEQREHARLTQQHNFRSAYNKLQQKLENLNRQYEKELEEHERELERVATQEKTLTQTILNKIASVRAEREKMAPDLGRLDGALQLALSPEVDRDEARIERGILLDVTRKLQDTVQNNAAEEQQLQNIAIEEMDILMDEINNLEQELVEERQLGEEAAAAHATRLNDLRAQIAKSARGPIDFDEEKKKLRAEIDALKEHWQALRGHIEERIEHTLDKTEKKKAEGRANLMTQRAELYIERHGLGETLKEATLKIVEEEKKIDTAKQLFEDRVKIKTKELNDQEDWHAERMQERTNRRDKRIKEMEMKERERAKRRNLEVQLLTNKQNKLIETFNVKKTHVNDAIKEAEERIKVAEDELCEPQKEDSDNIAGLQCALSDVAQKRSFLAEEKSLMKAIAKKEMEMIQAEGKNIKDNYSDQLKEKQKELTSLKHAHDKQTKQNKKRVSALENKFGKQIDKLEKDNAKLEEYIDNLEQEGSRLKREREVLKEEYATEQAGIRDLIKEDEVHIQKERDRIHEDINQERNLHEVAIDKANDKIQETRAQRHDMAEEFKKEINDFASRAVSMGPSGSGSPQARITILTNYQMQIQKYIKKVQEINDKIKDLAEEYSGEKDAKSKKKRQALTILQKQNEALAKELEKKQQLVKEGNRLLQLFINDDQCLYCKEKNPPNTQTDKLTFIHEENRKLTDKLTNLFKKEREYDKVSSKQMEELRGTLERAAKACGQENSRGGKRQRSRTNSQSSITSVTSTKSLY